MNRQVFFNHVRDSLFKKRLKQGQVDGLNTLLDEWGETGFTNRQWLAYCLATAFHETAFTMQPIREYGRGRGKKYGEKDRQTGQVYYGRGYVQLTWRFNYERASKALGVDFVRNPDGVMEPGIAAHILYVGCAEGWFTGKKLSDYINDKQRDYWNARRIVNGTDKAGAIAGYAITFEAALDAADAAPVQKPAQPTPPLHETEAPEQSDGWLTALIRLIVELFK